MRARVALTHELVRLREVRLFLRDHEVHKGSLTSIHVDGLFPSSGFAKNGPLNCLLAKDIHGILSSQHMPSFVPRNNFIITGRHIGKLEPAVLAGNCVVRVRNYHHFSVHPNVSAVAAQVDKAWSVHPTCDHAVGERKRQVEACSAVHVNRMQRRVGAFHRKLRGLRYQENMRFISTIFLVQRTSRCRQIHRLAPRDIL